MNQIPKKNSHLMRLDRKALDLKNSGSVAGAAELYAAIVKEQPDWEHGTGFYNLAGCYEDLGELALAEQCYRDALRYEPENPHFLGGLASFLYLHGDPQKAFASYLKLLGAETTAGNQRGIEVAKTALQTLGLKMGLSDADLAERIESQQKIG